MKHILNKKTSVNPKRKEKCSCKKSKQKYWKSIVIVQQKRMWCRKKKKRKKICRKISSKLKEKNMEDMMMMWNLMLWNAPFSTKSPLAQVWILCCFSSCYCVGFLRILNIFPSRTRTTNGWIGFFSTFYQLYLGVIWGIHIWPSKREMVDRSTNKRKQQKKQTTKTSN